MKLDWKGKVWAVVLLGWSFSGAAQDEVFRLTRTFDQSLNGDVPVSVVLPERPEFTCLELLQISGNDTLMIDWQMPERKVTELCWVVPGPVKRGETRTYLLRVCCGAAPSRFSQQSVSAGAAVIATDSTFLMLVRNKPVLNYFYAIKKAPAGVSPLFDRSGFIHPLWSPSGKELTWIQAPDHYHHYGIWNPWTKVTWKGHTTDFWNLGSAQGTVRYSGIESKTSGPVFGEIVVRQEHVAFFTKSGKVEGEKVEGGDGGEMVEELVMNERLRVRVWNVNGGFLVDYESELRVAIDEPVSLDVYRYGGGIGFRATSEWTEKNSEVITSEGKTWDNGDATRAKWCRVYGSLDGVETGVLFMSSASNFDHPQPMRIWPKKLVGDTSYHYFEFCPTREKPWILEPGKAYIQHYQLWISEGEMTMEEMEARYNLRNRN